MQPQWRSLSDSFRTEMLTRYSLLLERRTQTDWPWAHLLPTPGDRCCSHRPSHYHQSFTMKYSGSPQRPSISAEERVQ